MSDLRVAGEGTVHIAGAPHHYEVIGAGHPLVLIHEGIADSRMYDVQIAAFSERFRVIRYDVSGFGRSGVPAEPFSNHEVLHDLLLHLGADRAHVLGMSMGGGIALDFAIVHPEMVTGLVLAAAGIGGSSPSSAVRQQWSEIQTTMDSGDFGAAVELGLRMWVDGPRRSVEEVDPVVRERARRMMADTFALPDVEPRRLDPPAISRLDEILAPTLVVVGDGDVQDIRDQADLLSRSIVGARMEVIPNVAHVPNMERPEEFNRLVLEVLRAIDS